MWYKNLQLPLLIIVFVFINYLTVFAQSEEEKKEPPDINEIDDRAKEDYSYLKDKEEAEQYEKIFAQKLKYISLNKKRSIYFTLGGQYRPRLESTINENYTEEDATYYSQRLTFHSKIHFGKYISLFGELYHGLTSGEEDRFLEDDELAFHQAYAELTIPLKDNSLVFTFGRKQIEIGAARIVSRRDGPNMRRSFDMGKADFNFKGNSIEMFYGREVRPDFGTIDNEFTLLEGDEEINPRLWGVVSDFQIKNIPGRFQAYYLGYDNQFAAFSDVQGDETRHSIGLRRYGSIGKRGVFNTEVVYQFGDLNGNNISAFDIELDYKYILINSKVKPTFGMKFDYSSGDRNLADGNLNTYNPIFVNPALYSLAAVNVPLNINGLHPNFKIYPFKGFSIYSDYAFFFRSSKSDALYTSPRNVLREASAGSSAYLGSAFGIKFLYTINRNILFEWRTTYFIPGAFVKESGASNNIFYTAPTLEFNF